MIPNPNRQVAEPTKLTAGRYRLGGMLLLLAICHGVLADTLEVPSDIGATAETRKKIDKPTRGMTMDDVNQKYGAAQDILPAVGDPPITRWIYKDFVVTFERQYVIDAVVPRKPR